MDHNGEPYLSVFLRLRITKVTLALFLLSSCSYQETPTRTIDTANHFSNVGALIYVAEPNATGIPIGIISRCTGTLIQERVVLLAGHCTAPTSAGLLPFIKAFVTFSANALDRASWRPVSNFAFHPSLPPCPPPEGCMFHGLDRGILDVGLVFLDEPIKDIEPATLALPGALDIPSTTSTLMTVPGYGDISAPSGKPEPISSWDGLRRIKSSRLKQVVDNEWASWETPGIVCYGDSGAPTFFTDSQPGQPTVQRIVAVASDGGDVCFSRDDRARVDTKEAQQWIRESVRQVLGVELGKPHGQ